MLDQYNLKRFLDAQRNSYPSAVAEIRRGAKRGHWMWFTFPQFVGLGQSTIAKRYAIGSRGEARAYLEHDVLGTRLRECIAALQDLSGTNAIEVFGEIDAKKLRSSLTLFAEVGQEPLFVAALDRWFAGKKDETTLGLLAARVVG